MTKSSFYYEDGLDNVFNENGEKVVDRMEGVLTDIIDPNIVLVIITSREAYLAANPEDDRDTEMVDVPMSKVKVAEASINSTYINYDDHTREKFIYKMIEGPVKRGRVAAVARQYGIAYNTALHWWNQYRKTGEIPYRKSERNVGRPSAFSDEHEKHIVDIIEKNPQICADDIIDSLTSQFEGFSISKSQMNYHLKNNMLITVKKPTYEAKIRNSVDNLQTRYEWFMKWKDSDIDFDKNCVFIDEASFNINMRNNWARSTIGTPAIVELEKTRSPSHTIIGAIHSTSVTHIALKKPPPRKKKPRKPTTSKKERSKKRKLAKGNAQKAGEIVIEEPVIEYVEIDDLGDKEDNKPPSKGTTTAHFIKFMNEVLEIMDLDENLKGSYFVMDNCTIHKSHPMIRKIEGRGYKVMYLPPYSPELNAIENFWAVVKSKMKRENLMTEETLSQRIADACNNVGVSDLRAFCSRSKRHTSYCRDKIHF